MRPKVPKPEARRAESRGRALGEGDSEPPSHQLGGLSSAVNFLSEVRKLVLVHSGASKITNFNDFPFTLGMVVFGQVGLKSQQRRSKTEQVGLSPPEPLLIFTTGHYINTDDC